MIFEFFVVATNYQKNDYEYLCDYSKASGRVASVLFSFKFYLLPIPPIMSRFTDIF